ncbi:MAG: cytochrome c [Gammaproteobacteria bacterium]|nr:cytochrome c [Gammaproteobacteria bacterium]
MFSFKSLSLFILLTTVFSPVNSHAEDADFISEGGRLYDKWWQEIGLKKPATTHPSYPSAGRQKGANTWRCKECHGWDYLGDKGAYASGSHFTGIRGISDSAGRSIDEVMAILKNKTHRYDEVMLDYGLLRLSAFVSSGQVDIRHYFRPDSNKVIGNILNGKKRYNQSCKECHGSQGLKRNFGSRNKPEYMGTLANKNPWEAMHKLRNGHPDAFVMGDPMPHMLGKINLQQQLDLLAYLQTLPPAK